AKEAFSLTESGQGGKGSGGRLAGKNAIVTGSTAGIGRATAIRFAQEGARVVVHGRSAERGAEVVETIKKAGGEAIFVAADITNEAEVASLVAAARDWMGQIDVLVNNAGIVVPG